MALPYGFKARAERLTIEVRTELHLAADDYLDPLALADYYGIPVRSLPELVDYGAAIASIEQLIQHDPGSFSAGTIFRGSARLIVHNPAHSGRRRANSLAHELSHLLLEHEPASALPWGGCRQWDGGMEEQADLLAGTLLVPRDAALAVARAAVPCIVGAAHFGVSEELMRWRREHTGARRQATNEAHRRSRQHPLEVCADLDHELDRHALSDLAWLTNLTAAEWGHFLHECRLAMPLCAEARHLDLLHDMISRWHPVPSLV